MKLLTRHLRQRTPLAAAILSLSLVTALGWAGAAEQPRGIDLPVFPAVFDRPTVQALLDSVEQGQNDVVLFGGYFARNGTKQLPGSEGFVMLRGALEKSEVGGIRWFKLQYINTYATQRYGSAADALKAYEACFGAAENLQKTGKPTLAHSDLIARLIEQYVNMLPIGWWAATDLRTRNRVLAQAFRVWSRLPDEDSVADGIYSPHSSYDLSWTSARDAVGGAELVAEVERLLAAPPTGGADAQTLAAGAGLLEQRSPARALSLLRQANASAPKDNRSYSVTFRRKVRTQLIRQLSNANNWGEALSLQRQFIAENGFGQARLVDMLLTADRRADVALAIADLCKPEAPDNEVVLCIQRLGERWREEDDERAGKWQMQLLGAYVNGERRRTVDSELIARYEYVRALQVLSARDGKGTEHAMQAEKLLEFDTARYPVKSARERDLLRQLRGQAKTVASWKTSLEKPKDGVAATNEDEDKDEGADN